MLMHSTRQHRGSFWEREEEYGMATPSYAEVVEAIEDLLTQERHSAVDWHLGTRTWPEVTDETRDAAHRRVLDLVETLTGGASRA